MRRRDSCWHLGACAWDSPATAALSTGCWAGRLQGLLSQAGLRSSYWVHERKLPQLLIFPQYRRSKLWASECEGFLLPTPLFPHLTNSEAIPDYFSARYTHGQFKCTRKIPDDWLRFAKPKTPRWGATPVLYCLKSRKRGCSPPAVSRARPLPPRGTPVAEASCGRSQEACWCCARPVVTSGGAECRSAFEKQTQNKGAVNSEEH